MATIPRPTYKNGGAQKTKLALNLLFHFMNFAGYPYDMPETILDPNNISNSRQQRAAFDVETNVAHLGTEVGDVVGETCTLESVNTRNAGKKRKRAQLEISTQNSNHGCARDPAVCEISITENDLTSEKFGKERLTISCRHFLRTAVFLINVAISTINIVRYFPAILMSSQIDSKASMFMMFTLQWSGLFYVYLLSYIGVRRKVNALLFTLRDYEERYGYSFDVAAVNSKVKLIVITTYTLLPVATTALIFTFVLKMDLFKEHLTPFENAQGLGLIALTGYACVVTYLTFSCYNSLLLPLLGLSYVVKKEFLDMAQQFGKLFPKQERLVAATMMEAEKPAAQGNLTCEDRYWLTLEQNDHATTDAWTATSVTSSALEPTTTEVTQSGRQDFIGPENLPFPTAGLHRNTVSMEATFDFLCERHEAICSIVDHVQNCCVHYFPEMCVTSVVSLCFTVYSLAIGALPLGNVVAFSSAMMSKVSLLTIFTYLGCSVHDAAKAILPPMLTARKTCLPHSLLYKMQLTVQRLTTSEVGYNVYGLFVISRPAILMLTGTIVTYTVVVVQFQMGTCNCFAPNITAV